MSKRCGCGDILLCKYLIFIFIWVLIFSSVILTTVRDGMLSLGAPLGLTRTALGLWTDFSVLGLYLGWWLSELLPEVFPAMLEGCLKCVFLKLFTNSYRLLNSSENSFSLLTWTDWIWENLSSLSYIFPNATLLWDLTDCLCVGVHLIFLLLFTSFVLHFWMM